VSQNPVNVAVGKEDGKVILKFDRDVNHIEMDPQNALDITEAIATAAFECRDGVKPVGPALKAELIEKNRDELIPRITLMLAGMRGNKKMTDGSVAVAIIDTVFSKVFS
jgi:hypothetical protein